MDASGLVSFEVVHGETDLRISATRDLTAEARDVVAALRTELEAYAAAHPRFVESFAPLAAEQGAPEIVHAMTRAAAAAGVGPMAAVAGAVAERVARGLGAYAEEVIVENGGDLFIVGTHARGVLLLAGASPLSGRIAITLEADDLPCAICTSSGTVGHSVSLGVADAVTVIASDGALADAAATAAGNLVHGEADVERALERALSIPGIRAAVVVVGETIGALGGVRLEPVEPHRT